MKKYPLQKVCENLLRKAKMWYVIKDCSLPCSHLSEAEIPLQTDVAKKISLPVYWAPTQLSSWEEQGNSLSHQVASYLLLRLSWAYVTQRWNLSSSQPSLMDWRLYHAYSMLRILWPQLWLLQILRWWSYAKKGKSLSDSLPSAQQFKSGMSLREKLDSVLASNSRVLAHIFYL